MNTTLAVSPLDTLRAAGQSVLSKMERSMSVAMGHMIEFGNICLEAKKLVQHGEWEVWVRQAFDIAPNTAWKYMELARQAPNLPAGEDIALNSVRAGRLELPKPARPESNGNGDPNLARIQHEAQEAIDEPFQVAPQQDVRFPLTSAEQRLVLSAGQRIAQITIRWQEWQPLSAGSAERRLDKIAEDAHQLALECEKLAAAAHRFT